MDLIAGMGAFGYGEVHVGTDPATGLRAIVAIHSTQLGPALGGCRFIHYEDEGSAFTDALRLARGMTSKAALAGLKLGGGKSVIIKPKGDFDRAALFRSFGAFIDNLGGRYITAEDSGTSIADMECIRQRTRHVTGIDPSHGGSGDPSPYTALGVRRGIEACVAHRLKREGLDGVHVAVQGVGHVGYYLCRELHASGARLTVCDVEPARAERARVEFGATVVSNDAIFDVEAEVFAPCALGAVLDDRNIPRLRVGIVAGAANNQLAEPKHGDALRARGIAYAPDYAINAGGLINVALEVEGYDANLARERTRKSRETIAEILRRADAQGLNPERVADQMVAERLARPRR
jgi:leucine dehydrogenase